MPNKWQPLLFFPGCQGFSYDLYIMILHKNENMKQQVSKILFHSKVSNSFLKGLSLLGDFFMLTN